MNSNFSIAGRSIGSGNPPYIIAELSANHNGSIDNAFKIIEMAKRCGASAVKLQTYRADTITYNGSSEDFKINGGLWNGKTLYELYEWAHTPWDWHKALFEKAKSLDITIFSSPFDFTAVDFLEDLNAVAYKVASFELIDHALIKYIAMTKKPIIMSTGMASFDEISEAVAVARDAGCKELALLHCVSGYPAPASDYNLNTLLDMRNQFNLEVGLSDHTLSNVTALTSVALGASIIEKHVTLDRAGGGPDDSFSLEEAGLLDLCCSTREAWQSLGEINYDRKSSESENMQFRRSLYAVKAIQKGELFTSDNVRSIRPGYGLQPKFYDQVLESKASTNIEAGTPIKFAHLS